MYITDNQQVIGFLNSIVIFKETSILKIIM